MRGRTTVNQCTTSEPSNFDRAFREVERSKKDFDDCFILAQGTPRWALIRWPVTLEVIDETVLAIPSVAARQHRAPLCLAPFYHADVALGRFLDLH